MSKITQFKCCWRYNSGAIYWQTCCRVEPAVEGRGSQPFSVLSQIGNVMSDELDRLNWAVSAFASASAALVQSDDLQDLMEAVCQAIVTQSAYVLAWVVAVDTSSDHSTHLKSLSGAGPALGYMDGLALSSSSDFAEGNGPTGRAIRSGRPYLLNDTQTDPVFMAWRERAEHYGIRSSVTVPFKRSGEVTGALLVYANTPQAFSERVLEIFSQLGNQIAFAMSLDEDRSRLRDAEAGRRAAEEAMRSIQEDFRRIARITSMGELLASVAHEINQPLAAISMNSEACLRWLESDPPDFGEARAAIKRITRDAGRASEVIARTRSLLAKEPSAHSDFDLNTAIKEVLRFTHGEQHRAGVSVQTTLERDLPAVCGDRVQVQQVILNLVLNGIDAMRSVADRPRLLQVRTKSNGTAEDLVEVEDCGSGIDPDILDRLFDRFFTTKAKGIGLGLSISRSIIEAHGGRLWALRPPRFGAIFRFTLPVAEVSTE